MLCSAAHLIVQSIRHALPAQDLLPAQPAGPSAAAVQASVPAARAPWRSRSSSWSSPSPPAACWHTGEGNEQAAQPYRCPTDVLLRTHSLVMAHWAVEYLSDPQLLVPLTDSSWPAAHRDPHKRMPGPPALRPSERCPGGGRCCGGPASLPAPTQTPPPGLQQSTTEEATSRRRPRGCRALGGRSPAGTSGVE